MKGVLLIVVVAVTAVFGVYAFLTADLHSIAVSSTGPEEATEAPQSAADMAGILESVHMFELEKQKAGDFSLLSLSGDRVRLADYRGDTVLLSFWATW